MVTPRDKVADLPRVVGISGYASSGKTTVADYLVAFYGYKRIKFADGLKDMLRAVGLSDESIEGGKKEEPSQFLCGKSPRYAMQTLGTEWGRNLIGDNFWVNIWALKCEEWLWENQENKVVVDDVRFPNELQAVQAANGICLRIVRPGIDAVNAHPSECSLDHEPGLIQMVNDQDITTLQWKTVKELLHHHLPAA